MIRLAAALIIVVAFAAEASAQCSGGVCRPLLRRRAVVNTVTVEPVVVREVRRVRVVRRPLR